MPPACAADAGTTKGKDLDKGKAKGRGIKGNTGNTGKGLVKGTAKSKGIGGKATGSRIKGNKGPDLVKGKAKGKGLDKGKAKGSRINGNTGKGTDIVKGKSKGKRNGYWTGDGFWVFGPWHSGCEFYEEGTVVEDNDVVQQPKGKNTEKGRGKDKSQGSDTACSKRRSPRNLRLGAGGRCRIHQSPLMGRCRRHRRRCRSLRLGAWGRVRRLRGHCSSIGTWPYAVAMTAAARTSFGTLRAVEGFVLCRSIAVTTRNQTCYGPA